MLYEEVKDIPSSSLEENRMVRKQKTGKRERHIRLNTKAVAAFESIREGADTGGPVLPELEG
jgi:hypothetical protein